MSRLDGFHVVDPPGPTEPRPAEEITIAGTAAVTLEGPTGLLWRCVVEERAERGVPDDGDERMQSTAGLGIALWLSGRVSYNDGYELLEVGALLVRDREGALVSMVLQRELDSPSTSRDDEAVLRGIAASLDQREPLDLTGGVASFYTPLGRLSLDVPPGMAVIEHFNDAHGTTSWDIKLVDDAGQPWRGIALGWVGSPPYDEEQGGRRQGVSVGGTVLEFVEDAPDRLRAYTDPPEFTFVIRAPPGPLRDRFLAVLTQARITPNP